MLYTYIILLSISICSIPRKKGGPLWNLITNQHAAPASIYYLKIYIILVFVDRY